MPRVRLDLAVNPFGASVPEIVAASQAAEAAGYDAVWVTDHFSGAVVGASVSRDPFVCLAAIASSTRRIELGVLVANIMNRHPAQLASAVDSLRSLAPDRVRLGLGSGAAPGSRFAVEHEAIGRVLPDATERRRLLVESLGALRAIWRGDSAHPGGEVGFDGLSGVVDSASPPHMIVGASGWSTVEVALAHADGVNLRVTSSLDEHLGRLALRRPPSFEVSVLVAAADAAATVDRLVAAGCDRMILGVAAPFDIDAIELRPPVSSTARGSGNLAHVPDVG